MTRIPGLLICLLALPLAAAPGCGSGKKKKEEPSEEKTPPAETAKVAPAAPVELRSLPEDTGEHQAKLRLGLSYGSTDTDAARGLAIDSKGDYLVCGYFKGKGLFGADYVTEDSAAYLAKISATDGSPTWSVALGGLSQDSAEALAIGPDDSTILVGSLSGDFQVGDGTLKSAGADDIFIAKFASDGRRLWVKRIGSNDVDAGHAVIVDDKGNSFVTGVFRSSVSFGEEKISSKGDADIFLTKLSPEGEFLWTKTFGNLGADYGRDLTFDSKGNIAMLAEISLDVDFGGAALTTKGNRDIALIKFDSEGQHLWSKSLGNNFDDIGISLAVDSADNLLFTGSFEGTLNFGGEDMEAAGRSDMYVAKFDPNGEHLWSKHFGGKDKDWGNSIATDEFGNSYVTGWFWYEVDFGGTSLKSKGKEDVVLLKLDPQGSTLWARAFGGNNLDMGKAVAVDAKGGVVTVGAFNQEIDLGGGVLKPTPGEDPKILKGDFYLASFDK